MNHGRPAAGSALTAGDRRGEPQRREVDEAPPIRGLERIPVALDARRVADPALEVSPHARLDALRILWLEWRLSRAETLGHHGDVRAPLAVRRHLHRERQPLGIEPRRRASGDRGRSRERAALVAERELPSLHLGRVAALLAQGVLHLEEVGEVAARVDANGERDGLVGVVQDRQLLVEAGRDGALPDDGELRVDVDGSRPRHEEEPRLEVLEVVDGKRVQALAVHGEHPAREEARVEREEPRRIGERRLDVAARVAHDERVPVEDLDEAVVHALARLRRGPGNSRCMRTRSRQSPSTRRSPRSTAATAFNLPDATLSKTALSARMTHDASPPPA